ncbi:hypothetical protein [Mesorhizobium metallidurans]|nr:hypothetical protein [Mesorhizobium metallidurans]
MPSSDPLSSPSIDKFPGSTTDAVYQNLGVRPIINCTATRTSFGGSNPTQNVLDAMSAAARAFVDLDELAEAVGAQIGRLANAQWGVVTAGSTAALALAAAACIAGGDPEIMLRLPDTTDLPNGIIVFKTHRFAYDMVMRQVGAKLIEVSNQRELNDALSREPVMICLLARAENEGFVQLENLKEQASGIPIVVDAASCAPKSLDPWIARGADLVIYSGGKCLRGPQSSGFLIGRKDLCQAAWLNGPPHYSIGRGMKVGKEEIVGAVTALEDWLSGRTRVDEDYWLSLLDTIAKPLSKFSIVREVLPANQSFGQIAPRLRLSWPSESIVSGAALCKSILERHRVKLQDFWVAGSSIIIDPLSIQSPAEAETVGYALAEAFDAELNASQSIPENTAPRWDATGEWRLVVDYLHRRSFHELKLKQQCDGLVAGVHHGRFGSGTVAGAVIGNAITLHSQISCGPLQLFFEFSGALSEGAVQGVVTTGAAMEEHIGSDLCSQFGKGSWNGVRLGC